MNMNTYGSMRHTMSGRKKSYNAWTQPKKKPMTWAPLEVEPNIHMKEYQAHRDKYPSAVTTYINANSTAKKDSPKYTGTFIKGIATMHKSNAVPITNQQQATEIAQMAK